MNLRDVFEVKISTPLLAKDPYWDGQEKESHFNPSDSVENTGRTPFSYPIVYSNCGKKESACSNCIQGIVLTGEAEKEEVLHNHADDKYLNRNVPVCIDYICADSNRHKLLCC